MNENTGFIYFSNTGYIVSCVRNRRFSKKLKNKEILSHENVPITKILRMPQQQTFSRTSVWWKKHGFRRQKNVDSNMSATINFYPRTGLYLPLSPELNGVSLRRCGSAGVMQGVGTFGLRSLESRSPLEAIPTHSPAHRFLQVEGPSAQLLSCV